MNSEREPPARCAYLGRGAVEARVLREARAVRVVQRHIDFGDLHLRRRKTQTAALIANFSRR